MRQADVAGVSPRRKGFTRRNPKAALASELVERDFRGAGAEPAVGHRPDDDFHRRGAVVALGDPGRDLSPGAAWETSACADADLILTTLECALAGLQRLREHRSGCRRQ
ncbi:hypothetical protein ACFU7T_22295 [Streptomyces sp. NPDC057555]|uniref:hypothetical protein n=1 Tax=Streptomyces sp. NPDC057555 TaxID=3346166 RepID=UPI003694B351